jgi:hypothetical protein
MELVGSGIWHRQTGTIDNFDPLAQPELLVGDLAFELLGHLGAISSSSPSDTDSKCPNYRPLRGKKVRALGCQIISPGADC